MGTFFSTGSPGAGQETTAFTCIPFFAHMGMLYVTMGTKTPKLGDLSEVHGGSAYGAGKYFFLLINFLFNLMKFLKLFKGTIAGHGLFKNISSF